MSAPVKHTCPDIDKAIKLIKEAIREADQGKKLSDIDDMRESLRWVINQIEDLPYMLEDLRKANHSLREWGEATEDSLQKAEQTISDLESDLYDLNQKIEA